MLIFNYLFLLETYQPVARDICTPPFCQNFNNLDFQHRSMHLNEILFNIISFFIIFAYHFLKLTTISSPTSKLVPHFLVHSYSSASSMHVQSPSKKMFPRQKWLQGVKTDQHLKYLFFYFNTFLYGVCFLYSVFKQFDSFEKVLNFQQICCTFIISNMPGRGVGVNA